MHVIFEQLESIAAQQQANPDIPAFETKTHVLTERSLDALPQKGDEVRIKERSYVVRRIVWYLDGETYESPSSYYRAPFVIVRVDG